MERTFQKVQEKAEPTAKQRTLRVEVGGGSWVTVDVYGDPEAPGLVVVPGAMSDAHAWRQVAAGIDAWPSVAVVNRRGRAPSGPLTGAYSLHTEVEDLGAVLAALAALAPPTAPGPGGPEALFGWSYGGLIALLAAGTRPLRQVIAYEPVMRPFGRDVLPELRAAGEAADRDAVVEIVNRRIAGLDPAEIASLRADRGAWETLCRLAEPAYAELAALNATALPTELAREAERVDLIVGQRNRGTAPYGTSFDDVRERVPRAGLHELPGQGHLAHLEAPARLARLISDLAAA